MNYQDLTDLINFAKSKDLMKHSVIEVYNLWLKDLEEYYKDYIAEYYIDLDKAGLI